MLFGVHGPASKAVKKVFSYKCSVVSFGKERTTKHRDTEDVEIHGKEGERRVDGLDRQ